MVLTRKTAYGKTRTSALHAAKITLTWSWHSYAVYLLPCIGDAHLDAFHSKLYGVLLLVWGYSMFYPIKKIFSIILISKLWRIVIFLNDKYFNLFHIKAFIGPCIETFGLIFSRIHVVNSQGNPPKPLGLNLDLSYN